RRQSQLVEDLITEAFTKERRMNAVTTGMQDPEPNGLEPATTEAISMGQRGHEKFLDEMERLLQEEPTNLSTIRQGDVVEGVIVQIDQDEILVDIGLESMGVLSTKELLASGYGSFNE